MRQILVLLLLLALLAPPTAVRAADDTDQPKRIQDLVQNLGKDQSSSFAPTMTNPALLDEEGQAAQRAALKSYYDYRTEGFDHRRRVFEWQLLSSKIIFVLVVSLVAVGVFFSWLQFRQGLKTAGSGGLDSETTFEASSTGVKVSSPVLGVIILTISLGFFYLYLVYVFPIEEIL